MTPRRSLWSTPARGRPGGSSSRGSLTRPSQTQTGQDVWKVCHYKCSLPVLCVVYCVYAMDKQRQQRVSLSAPLCPKPPEIPHEGTAAYAPLILEDAPLEVCEVEQSALTLKCPSFTRLFVVSTEFGRRKGGKVTHQNTLSGHVTEYSSVIGRQGAVHRGKGHCGAHQRGLHLPGRQVSCDWLISVR